ncbi:MAG: type I-MYXAN CRISPR-associated Cas8a1/Cmx1 [Waterburya sp.]
MTELTLSIFDTNTLLPHRAGITGLALALSVINPNDVPFSWEVTEDAVNLFWDCSDREAVLSLLQQTYRLQDGYLDVPALNLDSQGKYTFTKGVVGVFLQHQQQRTFSDGSVSKSFQIDEGQPEITVNYKPIVDCYYTKEINVFTKKGQFNTNIQVKSQHLPGLEECFVHGAYKETHKGFLSLLFLPLACSYFQLPFVKHPDSKKKTLVPTYAIVIPEVTNILAWSERRKKLSGKTTYTYKNFLAQDAGETGLRLLLQEKLLEDLNSFRIQSCEVYKIGPQQWNVQQIALKQAIYRISVSDEILDLYDSAFQFFKPQVRTNDKGETWLAISKVLPWLCDNLIIGKPWYSGFYEWKKQNELYERKGLISMSQYLDALEQKLFDAVQGAFGLYRWKQREQAKSQNRDPDYGQITDKVVYRFQRPSTQQEFASALVQFLSQNRSTSILGKGQEIYSWIHGKNWKQARDLALLAIATYESKTQQNQRKKPSKVNESESTSTESSTEAEAEEGFEMTI